MSAPAESKHTPSEAALRAALALTRGHATTKPMTPIYCCGGGGWTTAEMAEVIDREFQNNHEELVEALKAAEKDLRLAFHANPEEQYSYSAGLAKVVAALAKVSGVSR